MVCKKKDKDHFEIHRKNTFENIWSSIEEEMKENTHAHHKRMKHITNKARLRQKRREMQKEYYKNKMREEL